MVILGLLLGGGVVLYPEIAILTMVSMSFFGLDLGLGLLARQRITIDNERLVLRNRCLPDEEIPRKELLDAWLMRGANGWELHLESEKRHRVIDQAGATPTELQWAMVTIRAWMQRESLPEFLPQAALVVELGQRTMAIRAQWSIADQAVACVLAVGILAVGFWVGVWDTYTPLLAICSSAWGAVLGHLVGAREIGYTEIELRARAIAITGHDSSVATAVIAYRDLEPCSAQANELTIRPRSHRDIPLFIWRQAATVGNAIEEARRRCWDPDEAPSALQELRRITGHQVKRTKQSALRVRHAGSRRGRSAGTSHRSTGLLPNPRCVVTYHYYVADKAPERCLIRSIGTAFNARSWDLVGLPRLVVASSPEADDARAIPYVSRWCRHLIG